MSLLGDLAGGFLGFMAGGPVGAAIGAGLGSAATGGNVKQDLLAAGAGYGLGTLGAAAGFGPETAAAGGVMASGAADTGALGSAFGITGDASTITGLADSTFGTVSGASPIVAGAGAGAGGTSPFLSATGDLGLGPDITTAGVMSGATTGLDAAGVGGLTASQLGSAVSSGSLSNSLISMLGENPTSLANITGSPQTGGLLSSFLNWAKDNKQLSAALVQTVGGLLNGIGTAANQREMAQYQQQLAEQLAQWQRSFTQSGDYWGAKVGISPSGNALTRPSGAPVYGSGGLIANALASS